MPRRFARLRPGQWLALAMLLLFFGVLLLRIFVIQPYRISSASMLPDLGVGDMVVVNRSAYALRLPLINTELIRLGQPKRGDRVVFEPPDQPGQVWLMRIVGLPGERIELRGNVVHIDGKPASYREIGEYPGPLEFPFDETGAMILKEELPGHSHAILRQKGSAYRPGMGRGVWTVPAGHYFVMGDNRDNSADSRFWTRTPFLPEGNLRGKVVLVWSN